jgi:hypothetical protein
MSKTFTELRAINVNDKVEKKANLSYLSWAWAWDAFKQQCPTATYRVIKSESGLPYFASDAGAMVYTEVTVDGITHEMWLPVMDANNKAMKAEPYQYTTRQGQRTVEAYTMFDVNKTIMRCLVKNLAMFGLALYIYAGEDLPEPDEIESRMPKAGYEDYEKAHLASLRDAAVSGIEALGKAFAELPASPHKADFWKAHGDALKKVAGSV